MKRGYSRKRKIISAVLALLLSLSLCPASSAAGSTIEGTVVGTERYDMAWEILDIVNQERSAEGKAPLTMDESLMEYGMLRAAECSVYFSHTRPDGSSCASGMPASEARGENIAAGARSATEVVDDWMNSTGHKANILNADFRNIGIGVYYVGNRYYYAQVFTGTLAAAKEPARSTNKTEKSVTTQVALGIASLNIEGTAPSYNIHIGGTKSLDLPSFYISTGEWGAKVGIKASDLAYKVVDSTVATVASGSLSAVKAGSTKLKVYLAGDESKALEFPVVVSAHNYESSVVAPTCKAKGYTKHTCSICQDTYQDNETAMIDHDYETKVVEATCTSGGHTEHTCKVCGESYNDNATSAKPHTYKEEVVEKTCTVDGYTRHVCEDCGNSYDEPAVATGHAYVPEIVAPTCEEKGYTVYTCSNDNCGHSYMSDEVPALGHVYGEGVNTLPTCTTEGYTEYECTACSETKRENITAALGHDFALTSTVEATCTAEGYAEHTCSHCNEVKREDVTEALGHSFGDWSVTLEPTITATGIEKRQCARCNESETKQIAKLQDDSKATSETTTSGTTKTSSDPDKKGQITISKVVATGDDNNLVVYLVFVVLSLGILGYVLYAKNTKKKPRRRSRR
ncbi:CAP domain-containing protein [Lachnospiraceae bacterium PAL227]|uniref:CAP domain-containing protein n=1 Tax=Ohessyouella blattaphilus TaxID=2949333 RepID=A0ABT1ELH8_9FIRM|nr:CAP domain-containing protein [Ohessyouella blattaphilus]MCP1111523.1 CAP domain-containing protein [Ohessyouella blattaphilus]MCR8564917.1 CAP domain-containing protein [Ohessyouella blattaphilus]